MKKTMIFVVDDDDQIRQLLHSYLVNEGYEVQQFARGSEALSAYDDKPCDLWIIDIMMPEMDGYTLCREIRRRGDTPVIIVSAKDEEIDRILGLELGSDDYIAKPFSPRELLVRVKNILRRLQIQQAGTPPGDLVRIGEVSINTRERQVTIDGQLVPFTAKEYALLLYLTQNRNTALAREQIIESIWGYDHPGDMRQVDDLIKRVRRKLISEHETVVIETIWGFGYKLTVRE